MNICYIARILGDSSETNEEKERNYSPSCRTGRRSGSKHREIPLKAAKANAVK